MSGQTKPRSEASGWYACGKWPAGGTHGHWNRGLSLQPFLTKPGDSDFACHRPPGVGEAVLASWVWKIYKEFRRTVNNSYNINCGRCSLFINHNMIFNT